MELERIRLFEVNRNLCNLGPGNCLLMFNLGNHCEVCCDHTYYLISFYDVKFFFDRDRTQQIIRIFADDSGCFLGETSKKLAKEAADFLFACFRITSSSFSDTVPILVLDTFRTMFGMLSTKNKVHFTNEDDREEVMNIFVRVMDPLGVTGITPAKFKDIMEKKEFTRIKPLVIEERVRSGKDSIKDRGEECSICVEMFEIDDVVVIVSPCSHVFHRNCILEWMLVGDSCPLCRTICVTKV